jgi:hypothetical protein
VIGFPLLLIPFAIYNMIAFLTPGVSWTSPVYSVPVPLKSGIAWTATIGDAFLAFALLMLMFEFIKSTRHGKSFVEHFLSLLLAGGAAAEFWMVREAGNSVFMLFVVICFVDLFAGFAASLRRARRRVAVETEEPLPPVVPPARAEPARAEPFTRIEPARPVEPVRPEAVVKADPVQKVES